jgi:glycosyltransferase involved in cell wall biosynthesis
MTISVAIATYNRAPMVEEAVKAALAQTLTPDEIVISDDASTDHTWETLAKLAEANNRVRILRQSHNTGGVENWNAAVSAAQGEYIAWCSDDDLFEHGHLAASISYLQQHPDVGLVHSGFVDYVDLADNAREVEPRPLRSSKPMVLRPADLFWYVTRYYNWPFHPSTLVMRRHVWETVGPFDRAFALADTDWFVRVAERYAICLLPRHGVFNRRHLGNWSNRVGSAQMQSEIFEIVERAMERRWPTPTIERSLWRAVWRTTVRLHLLLTLYARIRGGHLDAALSVWRALTCRTRRKTPKWLRELGARWIRQFTRSASQFAPRARARARVSPL